MRSDLPLCFMLSLCSAIVGGVVGYFLGVTI